MNNILEEQFAGGITGSSCHVQVLLKGFCKDCDPQIVCRVYATAQIFLALKQGQSIYCTILN